MKAYPKDIPTKRENQNFMGGRTQKSQDFSLIQKKHQSEQTQRLVPLQNSKWKAVYFFNQKEMKKEIKI